MPQYIRRTLLACLVLILGTTTLRAAITGSMSGHVVDPTGAYIAGAKVTIRNEATGISQMATADGAGFYTFPALNVGTYTVSTAPRPRESRLMQIRRSASS